MSKGPRDKRMSIDDVVGELKDGMTIGIGGWAPGASRWHWCERSSTAT